ncbi:NADPH-dependent FMN reductase [Wenzhouxiangella marina]|uniref:NADPH-dependent FMN reductase n=1 Tax=Wenzhouxiangella marina TaxID=1579979 RepID=A0A0K0XVD7_9GAMM|nr:NADPH-dependent FMN reductase [Wenzhouxiangella marina]AKS41643.1 NADPH-dependent FMN reductase [Wenzhouxiangella marina]MBB6086597.1 NAD(P)H-dependent FMN reductase [Wenzhouxiangella marina]
MKLVAISGSLRQASFNTRLGRLMADLSPAGCEVVLKGLHGIPLYNADDEEARGIPEAVEALRGEIKAADGLILITPEYNGAMPGVLKNALDWLTRPGEEMKPTFGHRPTALAGATPGAWGTAMAQSGALINLRQLGVNLFPDFLRVSRAGTVLGDGEVDAKLRDQVGAWLERFVEFARG